MPCPMMLMLICISMVSMMTPASGEYCQAGDSCSKLEKIQIMTSSFHELSGKLVFDTDIQSKLNGIEHKGNQISAKFSKSITEHGINIFRQKSIVMTAKESNEIVIKDMQTSLGNARNDFASTKDGVVGMQTDVHVAVEDCRERKMKHENAITSKEASVRTFQDQLNGLQVNIDTYERDANELNTVAQELDNRANDLRNAAEKKEKNGIFGFVVGILLAPITGGTSLLAAAAIAGVNTNDADDCNRNAHRHREDATNKRQQAKALGGQTDTLLNQKSSLEAEIERLQNQKKDLEKASSVLGEATTALQSYIPVFNTVINAIQDMETALKATQIESDSFKIIQKAFSSRPSDEKSQKYLDTLQSAWINLEEILKSYGVHP